MEELAPPRAMFPWLSCCTFGESASAPRGLVAGACVERKLGQFKVALLVGDGGVLGVDRVAACIDGDAFRLACGKQRDRNATLLARCDRDGGNKGVGKTVAMDGERVFPGLKSFDTEGAGSIAEKDAVGVFGDGVKGDARVGDGGPGGVLHGASQCAEGGLRQPEVCCEEKKDRQPEGPSGAGSERSNGSVEKLPAKQPAEISNRRHALRCFVGECALPVVRTCHVSLLPGVTR